MRYYIIIYVSYHTHIRAYQIIYIISYHVYRYIARQGSFHTHIRLMVRGIQYLVIMRERDGRLPAGRQGSVSVTCILS